MGVNRPWGRCKGRVITDVVPFALIQSLFCSIPCLQLGIPPISNESQLRTDIGKLIITELFGRISRNYHE